MLAFAFGGDLCCTVLFMGGTHDLASWAGLMLEVHRGAFWIALQIYKLPECW